MDDKGQFRVPPDRLAETAAARLALTLVRPWGRFPWAERVIQPVLDLMVATLRRRHEGAFERLVDLGEADLLVDPVDLPSTFILHIGATPGLRLLPRDAERPASVKAVIRGAFPALLDLFEGRIDGDALFFSRDLTIEGDTELVVGLRNALDGEEFDLAADFGSLVGPLARLPVRQPVTVVAETLLGLHEALLMPALRRIEHLERRIGRLEEGRRPS